MFKIGDKVDLVYGTEVQVNTGIVNFNGIVVGKSTTDITQQHLIKCTDNTFPNSTYQYDTLSIPLHCINLVENLVD